jgi:hypothetical protein
VVKFGGGHDSMPIGRSRAGLDSVLNLNLRAHFSLRRKPHVTFLTAQDINIADLAAFEVWPPYVPWRAAGLVYVTRLRAAGTADSRKRYRTSTVLLPENFNPDFAAHYRDHAARSRWVTGRRGAALLYLLKATYVTARPSSWTAAVMSGTDRSGLRTGLLFAA